MQPDRIQHNNRTHPPFFKKGGESGFGAIGYFFIIVYILKIKLSEKGS